MQLPKKRPVHLKSCMRGHLDGVRRVVFSHSGSALFSVSEDCMLNCWHYSGKNDEDNIDPYLSIREHMGPIFTMAITPASIASENNVVYTAGTEGVIRAWNLPFPKNNDPKDIANANLHSGPWLLSQWRGHCDTVWDLAHHPTEPLIISSGADGSVKLWQSFESDEDSGMLKIGRGVLLGNCVYKPHSLSMIDVPTSVSWLPNFPTHFCSGYVLSNSIVTFDIETVSPQ